MIRSIGEGVVVFGSPFRPLFSLVDVWGQRLMLAYNPNIFQQLAAQVRPNHPIWYLYARLKFLTWRLDLGEAQSALEIDGWRRSLVASKPFLA